LCGHKKSVTFFPRNHRVINRVVQVFRMAKQFSLEEVKAHNSASDVWMIIHDKVYDLSKFVTEVSIVVQGFA
jgi:cytochrome b involved in lipid metabolism